MTRNKSHRQSGFTLVELLVVIAIIGILVGMTVTGISKAREYARLAAVKVDINFLAQAAEDYRAKYGDYPPDFSNWQIVERHYRKAFPKILNSELQILLDLVYPAALHPSGPFSIANTGVLPPDPQGMDRAEALVFCLGGYSTDPQKPFTGPGGPLAPNSSWTPATTGLATSYQYNVDRTKEPFDFGTRLSIEVKTITINSMPVTLTASTDEDELDNSSYVDILPVYRPSGLEAPYVYFHSRSYAFPVTNDLTGTPLTPPGTTAAYFNYYAKENIPGVARPYKSNLLNTETPKTGLPPLLASDELRYYENKDSFQIISASLDNAFGGGAAIDAMGNVVALLKPSTNPFLQPVLYVFPTGEPYSPGTTVSFSKYSAFVTGSIDPQNTEQLDNITNFSQSKLESELEY